MTILIDIGHPAHVHYFKSFSKVFVSKGHNIIFTCREKDVTVELLDTYNCDFVSLGKPYKSLPGKVFGLVFFNLRLLSISLRYKPNIFLSAGSIYAAHIAYLMRKPHIALEDTGNMEQIRLYLPFSKTVLTPASFHKDLGTKQIRIRSYHELAYLYPGKFSADKQIRSYIGLEEDEQFVIMRFVSWNASHDFGNKGLSIETKRKLIAKVAKKLRVFISSEKTLPTEFEKYKLEIPAHKIHDLLSEAEMYIGEGATMASECSMLGTPAVYVNPLEAGTISDQGKAGLCFHFRSEEGVLEKVEELLSMNNLKDHFKIRKDLMLSEKIDFTEFLVWFVENWPESFKIMKENPDYQERFRLK